jgi:ribosomal protein S18 acetylase RimI-like enzyme
MTDELPVVSYATAADIDAIVALQLDWAAEGITRGFVPDDPDELRAALGRLFLVARIGGGIAGFVRARERTSDEPTVVAEDKRYLDVDDIYVAAAWRNRGIGGQLLDALLENARASGIDHFQVQSSNMDTDRILGFYRKHGFQVWFLRLFRDG